MTEFSALKYVAAATVLVLILGFLMFWQAGRGFADALRSQSWLFVGVPLQILYVLVGYFVGLGTMLALVAVTVLYGLAQLWLADTTATPILAMAKYRLGEYHRIRVHHPAH